MGEYELDLNMAGISIHRFAEIFTLRMGFDQDPDYRDIYTKRSQDKSLHVGTLINDRWIDIKGDCILQFLSNPNFTPTELGNIIHNLKFVNEDDFEGDIDDE